MPLSSSPAVAAGYTTIIRNIQSARPGAKITGVHVQRMLPKGQKVIVGAVQDPQFGPLAMFGSGDAGSYHFNCVNLTLIIYLQIELLHHRNQLRQSLRQGRRIDVLIYCVGAAPGSQANTYRRQPATERDICIRRSNIDTR